MIESTDAIRALFSIPRDVAYLNAAAYGPLPNAVRDAGARGAAAKSLPWTLDRPAMGATAERVRAKAARLIGAGADDVAIMGSISHAIATAALNLPAPRGTRILRLAGEHSSQVMAWQRRAEATGAVMDVVPRPADDDWTAAVLARIAAPGAPVAIAALTPLHWTDGTVVDLDRIAPALRRHGAALVVDATQAAGAMPLDVAALRPDFLAFPTYKWVLGSYNLAFLYAAPAHQGGEPLDRNGFNTLADDAVLAPSLRQGARRYDMGERDNPVALPMAEAALDLVLEWTSRAVAARLRSITDRLAEAAGAAGLVVPRREHRAAHVLGVRLPAGTSAATVAALAERGVHVSDRQGTMRVSPHVYNDGDDVARFAAVLAEVTRGR